MYREKEGGQQRMEGLTWDMVSSGEGGALLAQYSPKEEARRVQADHLVDQCLGHRQAIVELES